jgi:FkbM family methyltransferase
VDHSETADAVRRVLPGQMFLLTEVARQTHASVIAQGAAIAGIEARLSQIDAQSAAISVLRSDLDAVREVTEQLAGGNWLETVAKLGERSELLVLYTELLLQRNVIPLGQDFAVRTDAGYLLVPSEDPALLVAVVESRGRLEPGTLGIVLSLLPEGGLLVDVGASVGTFALPAARKVGPRGRVVALEPAPRVAALLRRTIALNHLDTVVDVHECAAGEAARTAEFALSALTTHNSFWQPDDTVEVISVAVRPLDAMLAPDSRVDVVKIDVEGAELQVWRGMQRIVSNNPDIAVVLEFGPEHLRRAGVSVEDWFAELIASGLSAWEIDKATASVRPLRSAGLGDVFSLNILLMRDHPERRGLRTT